MLEDREKWNARFAAKTSEISSPEPTLMEHLDLLLPGSLLDVACGDGRNALALACRGWEVTGVDIADVGLKRLQGFALERGCVITTHPVDLDTPEQWPSFAPFDNLLICHFKPPAALWAPLLSLLRTGGRVFYCTFHADSHVRFGFSRRFCVDDAELASIDPRLRNHTQKRIELPKKVLSLAVFERV